MLEIKNRRLGLYGAEHSKCGHMTKWLLVRTTIGYSRTYTYLLTYGGSLRPTDVVAVDCRPTVVGQLWMEFTENADVRHLVTATSAR